MLNTIIKTGNKIIGDLHFAPLLKVTMVLYDSLLKILMEVYLAWFRMIEFDQEQKVPRLFRAGVCEWFLLV